jgi:hypothetical protein
MNLIQPYYELHIYKMNLKKDTQYQNLMRLSL